MSETEKKNHYKLYKAGKLWCTALVAAATLAFGASVAAHADTVAGTNSGVTVTETQSVNASATTPESQAAAISSQPAGSRLAVNSQAAANSPAASQASAASQPVNNEGSTSMAVAASSNQNAAPQNGFYEHNGHTYYYENNRMYQNREYDNWGHVYYFGSDGARVDNQDATIVNGKHAGATYYFGNDGAALTDHFQNKNGKTYYYGDNGQQYRNRFYTNWGHTYYFGSDGARYTNQFMWNNGKLYYFGSDGAMYQDQFYTNWGHTYYFGSDGARYTNQSYTNWGHSYYFDGLGALATNQYITQDGIRYWADGQGILTISTPVVNSAENYIDGHDYYVDANGTRHAQTQYDGWQWPFPQRSGDYFLSGQLFGQSAASSFRKNSFHDGLDFGVTTYPGTYVQAVHGGKVIAVSYTPGCEYYVLVDDGRYLYMYQEAFTGYDQIYVHQGQVIHPGTIIGRRNTSHLHLGITANHDFENDLYNSFNANGPWLNPATVIRDGIAGRLK